MRELFIILLLFLTGCKDTVTTPKYKGYLKTFTPRCVVWCGEEVIDLNITTKKLTLRTNQINLDLEVTGGSPRLWDAKNKDGVRYRVAVYPAGKDEILVIIPDPRSGLLAVGIAEFNICQ